MGRETEVACFGSHCTRQSRPWVILVDGNFGCVSKVSSLCTYTLCTVSHGPQQSTALTAAAKHRGPSKPSVYPTQGFYLQGLNLLLPPELGHNYACWSGMLVSGRVEPQSLAQQFLLHLGTVQWDAGHADSSGIPSRMAMLRKQGDRLVSRLQPTSEQLQFLSWYQEHRVRMPSSPCRYCQAPLTGPEPWPVWLSGTGAFLADKSAEPAPAARLILWRSHLSYNTWRSVQLHCR